MTSGIKIGSPALTMRGMKEGEMKSVASMILKVINHHDDTQIKDSIRREVAELCDRFPVYKAL